MAVSGGRLYTGARDQGLLSQGLAQAQQGAADFAKRTKEELDRQKKLRTAVAEQYYNQTGSWYGAWKLNPGFMEKWSKENGIDFEELLTQEGTLKPYQEAQKQMTLQQQFQHERAFGPGPEAYYERARQQQQAAPQTSQRSELPSPTPSPQTEGEPADVEVTTILQNALPQNIVVSGHQISPEWVIYRAVQEAQRPQEFWRFMTPAEARDPEMVKEGMGLGQVRDTRTLSNSEIVEKLSTSEELQRLSGYGENSLRDLVRRYLNPAKGELPDKWVFGTIGVQEKGDPAPKEVLLNYKLLSGLDLPEPSEEQKRQYLTPESSIQGATDWINQRGNPFNEVMPPAREATNDAAFLAAKRMGLVSNREEWDSPNSRAKKNYIAQRQHAIDRIMRGNGEPWGLPTDTELQKGYWRGQAREVFLGEQTSNEREIQEVAKGVVQLSEALGHSEGTRLPSEEESLIAKANQGNRVAQEREWRIITRRSERALDSALRKLNQDARNGNLPEEDFIQSRVIVWNDMINRDPELAMLLLPGMMEKQIDLRNKHSIAELSDTEAKNALLNLDIRRRVGAEVYSLLERAQLESDIRLTNAQAAVQEAVAKIQGLQAAALENSGGETKVEVIKNAKAFEEFSDILQQFIQTKDKDHSAVISELLGMLQAMARDTIEKPVQFEPIEQGGLSGFLNTLAGGGAQVYRGLRPSQQGLAPGSREAAEPRTTAEQRVENTLRGGR